ncbi:uncharacterized protein TRAVEDRAFT_53953 [Trametes versicolor FP-101664 SS1]|uniref:Uncharacterized protein n=1 Tax=Trametes versicolor (strain FP-101664) TaxID=717944 RepID=R7S7F3_TRAVS|nr:uncharacterized protein TRAVEDRAFT_53953 [Trametes versicolor FP-101664 SS1]EIW51968.1 hypothetical protein TRAVEDRAFT_53953 [Trametes versicolor FP-101664 SS1]
MPRFLMTLPSSTPQASSPDAPLHVSAINASRVSNGLPNVDDHSESRISVFNRLAHRRRTIVHAEYLVYSDGYWDRDPRASPRPCRDADVRYAMEESVEALRHENDAMRMQITTLSSQHALDMQDIDRKMCDMLARLDALTGF